MPPRKLHVAPDLALPLEAVTQTFSLLAKRGAGKTYTAAVIAEEMLKAELPICVIDPTGVWWGLRASADGRAPGLPIIVMGGQHGDVPLEENAGEIVARFLVEEGVSVVLDLKGMRKAAQIRFLTPFAEALYHLNRNPLHIFWDECDAHLPQKPMKDQLRLLGAGEDIVRRGRANGLGVSLISQRAAVVNKDVLTQTEVLIALRTTGPQDIAAVRAWVEQHDVEGVADQMLGALPSLPIGDSWWWSPGWLNLFRQVRVRERETFDSSRTPKVGEVVRKPKQLAAVDLEGLRTRMAATIERAKADDPKVLKARITELERAVKAAERRAAPPPAGASEAEVEAAVQAARARWAKQFALLVQPPMQRLRELLPVIDGVVAGFEKGFGELVPDAPAPARPAASASQSAPRRVERPSSPTRAVPPVARAEGVTAPQQRILDAIATFEALGIPEVSRSNVAVFSDQSPRSSGFANNLGALRTAGLIDYPSKGCVALTEAGRAHATAAADVATLADLHDAWAAQLPRPQWAIVEQLVQVYPRALERSELAKLVGQSPTSSGYANNLGALRGLGLIDYQPGRHVVATGLLFPEGLR